MIRQLIVALLSTIVLTAAGECGGAPKKTAPTEDTSDERIVQFHETGQLQYGKWYEPQGNTACRWRVETKPSGDDAKRTVLETGSYDDAVRVRAEKKGWDVYLVFNKACGWFEEVPR